MKQYRIGVSVGINWHVAFFILKNVKNYRNQTRQTKIQRRATVRFYEERTVRSKSFSIFQRHFQLSDLFLNVRLSKLLPMTNRRRLLLNLTFLDVLSIDRVLRLISMMGNETNKSDWLMVKNRKVVWDFCFFFIILVELTRRFSLPNYPSLNHCWK